MLPTQPVETIGTYAGGNPEYMQEPTDLDFANGVKPLDTLPAGWWNWLWNKITLNEGRTVTVLNSIFDELLSVLNEAGIQPNAQQNNQIRNAIKLIIQASTGVLENLTTADKADLVTAINELNTAIGTLSSLETADKANLVTAINSLISTKGRANGIASLDAEGRIPYSQLPESAVEFKGTWDAATNTPTLTNGTGVNGDMYIVSVEGVHQGVQYYVGDRIIYSGDTNTWDRLGGGNVTSVNGKTGAVELTGTDIKIGGEGTEKDQSISETVLATKSEVTVQGQMLVPTYVVYDDSTLSFWLSEMKRGNGGYNKSYDFSRVLIKKGYYMYSQDSGASPTLDIIGTHLIVGEPGNSIVVKASKPMFAVAESAAANYDIRIEGLKITNGADSAIFAHCKNISNCYIAGSLGMAVTTVLASCEYISNCTFKCAELWLCSHIDKCTATYSYFYSCNYLSDIKNTVDYANFSAPTLTVFFESCNHLARCEGTTKGDPNIAQTIFNSCKYLTDCVGSTVGQPGKAFYSCKHLTNCYGSGTTLGEISQSKVGHGFDGCTGLINCKGYGGGGTYGTGFNNCISLQGCEGIGAGGSGGAGLNNCRQVIGCRGYGRSDFSSCYASFEKSSTYTCADTANGGFNSHDSSINSEE